MKERLVVQEVRLKNVKLARDLHRPVFLLIMGGGKLVLGLGRTAMQYF